MRLDYKKAPEWFRGFGRLRLLLQEIGKSEQFCADLTEYLWQLAHEFLYFCWIELLGVDIAHDMPETAILVQLLAARPGNHCWPHMQYLG